MGLQEKRLIKGLTDEAIPEFVEKVKKLIGTDVTVNFDWASFEAEPKSFEYANMTLNYCLSALQKIASDDLGKEALRETVKAINIKNVTNKDHKSLTVANGTVTFECAWGQGEVIQDDRMHRDILKAC